MLKPECILAVCMIILFQSCTNDKFETDLCASVSYVETIQPIINMKCAVSGCHVSGFQPGDFTNYQVLKQKVDDGKLQLVVFDLKIMPPVNKLSDEETSIVKCWIANGAKSN